MKLIALDFPNNNIGNILQSSHELWNDCISNQINVCNTISNGDIIQYESQKSGDDFTQNENDQLKNSIDLCKNSDFADTMMNVTLIIISSVFLQHILKLED